MPKKRKGQSLDKKTPRASKQSEKREAESESQRCSRLESVRSAKRKRLEAQSAQGRADHLETLRSDFRKRFQNETKQDKEKRSAKRRALQNRKRTQSAQYSAVTFNTAEFQETDLPEDILNFTQTTLWDIQNQCSHCLAYKFPSDPPGQCCNNGKVQLPCVRDPPSVLKKLLSENRTFKNSIRSYNNAMSLASIGFDHEVVMPGFSPNVKIQGKIYHSIGSLFPDTGEPKKFAQIYVHDEDISLAQEARERGQIQKHHGHKLDLDILQSLSAMMHQCNPFVQDFKTASDLPDNIVRETKLVLRKDKKPTEEHARRYNLPVTNEVALIALNESHDPADVVINLKGGGVRRISDLNRTFDPLHYVLLFPFGDDGWHVNMWQTKEDNTQGAKISPTMFYSHRLQVREGQFNHLIRSGRLMQEYAVAQFYKAERQRLKWLLANQKQIRAEKYNGLMDAIHTNDGNDDIGQRVILPATHYGSPRWYQESFQDAMAIVRHYGKPHLFITFTANAQWPEITESLYPGEETTDRPDLVARVFNMKVKSFLNDITKGEVFGKVTAYMAVKEDQKRGLPHIHVLVILADKDAPKTPDDYDRFVCAEIPDQEQNPELFKLVKKFMIHGPCEGVNMSSPCLNKTKKTCEKNYPKELISQTISSDNSYPIYRRRSTEEGGNTAEIWVSHVKQTITLDNRWVVPYNPWLLLKYQAHINTEIVASVGGVKYLYKYINKGSDRVMVEVPGQQGQLANNEIQRFTDARYISASEALWRLYGFPISQKYPPVEKLPVHLEGEQVVIIHEGETPQAAAERTTKTQLTEFFQLNQEDPEAIHHLYPDILRHYTWNKQQKKYRPRILKSGRLNDNDNAKSEKIGRIPVISINCHNKELYFLRMLLHHKRGPTSFQDVRTVDGEVCSNFQEACVKMGLFDDDKEIEKSLEEAATIKFGRHLRELFVTLVLNALPANPRQLWDKFKVDLCEDFMRKEKLPEPTEAMVNAVLLELMDMFAAQGKDMVRDFNLPGPDLSYIAEKSQEPKEIQEEKSHFHEGLAEEAETDQEKLNAGQREVFNAIKASVDNETGGLFAIDAPGGTGKTFVLKTILAYVRGQEKMALAMATSGIAATLLPGGRTIHSKLSVPINLTETSMCSIKDNSGTAKLIQQCSLMIIDEVTMGDRKVFETLDRTFREFTGKQEKAFGGVTMVFSGDWRQCLPVVPGGSKAQIIHHTFKMSDLWSEVKIFKLAENMRVQLGGSDEKEFSEYLLRIGEGTEPRNPTVGEDSIIIPDNLKSKAKDLKNFCDEIFPELRQKVENGMKERLLNEHWDKWLMSRAIICPTNKDAAEVNDILLEKLSGEEQVYLSCDKVRNEEEAHRFPTEFLNSISLPSIPPHKLTLKLGAPIMLLRNLNPAKGHVNGARYYVKALKSRMIHAQLASGAFKGEDLLIPRIFFHPRDKSIPFEMERKQFPIRPCFGITSNKSQGQTLSKVGIYLKQDFFSHGQMYVALSRVGSAKNISIYKPKSGEESDNYMANVVYKEILS